MEDWATHLSPLFIFKIQVKQLKNYLKALNNSKNVKWILEVDLAE